MARQSLRHSGFKERSPADCKFLRQTLKNEWGISLPQNMMPMAQLKAIVGALPARKQVRNRANIKTLFQFKNIDVSDYIKV